MWRGVKKGSPAGLWSWMLGVFLLDPLMPKADVEMICIDHVGFCKALWFTHTSTYTFDTLFMDEYSTCVYI